MIKLPIYRGTTHLRNLVADSTSNITALEAISWSGSSIVTFWPHSYFATLGVVLGMDDSAFETVTSILSPYSRPGGSILIGRQTSNLP